MRKGMSSITLGFVAGFALAVGGASIAQAAPGTWHDPVGGWEAVYQASSSLLPSQPDPEPAGAMMLTSAGASLALRNRRRPRSAQESSRQQPPLKGPSHV